MQIVKTGDEEFRISMTPAEGRIFINCMNETEKALGRAFSIRIGGPTDEVKALFNAIEAALK